MSKAWHHRTRYLSIAILFVATLLGCLSNITSVSACDILGCCSGAVTWITVSVSRPIAPPVSPRATAVTRALLILLPALPTGLSPPPMLGPKTVAALPTHGNLSLQAAPLAYVSRPSPYIYFTLSGAPIARSFSSVQHLVEVAHPPWSIPPPAAAIPCSNTMLPWRCFMISCYTYHL